LEFIQHLFFLQGDNSVYHVVQVDYGDGFIHSVDRSSLVDGPDLEYVFFLFNKGEGSSL